MLRSSRTSASARPPPSRGPTGGRRFPGVAASLLGGGLGRAAVILLVALLGVPRPAPAAEDATFDYWLTGNAADARPPQTRPGLFLSGGGGDVAAAWKWFVACAGGGDIVILRASGGNGYQSYVFDEIGGADSVETIKFNDPAAATDPRVLDLIRRAEGIFLAGGDQARYVRLWKDTPIAAALNEHLRRGRPLGGTSAGLAVLGQYYFSALADTITSPAALADPFDRRLTVGRDFLQAPELVGVLTDSHFMARQRLGRLITFLARVQHDERPSRLAGLGLDEGTALCVEPGGSSRVFSEKQGLAWLVLPPPDPPALVPGQPLAVSGVRVLGLGPDSHLDLAQFKVDRPAVRRTVQVTAGRVEDHANPSP
ncbi:MAG: cyanophycinase [Verrucomicrobia bacterium]|nr:cyanophycinase [Verrucomicrobiota bacterium]